MFEETLRFDPWIIAFSTIFLSSAAFAVTGDGSPAVVSDIVVSSLSPEPFVDSITAITSESQNLAGTSPEIVPIAYMESNIAASTSTAKAIDVNWRYFLSGAICCSFSHGVSVPCKFSPLGNASRFSSRIYFVVDVIKTRIQTRPGVRTTEKPYEVAKQIVKTEGFGALLEGMGPTLVGFALQGSLKYGFYDVFKQVVSNELLALNWHWEKLFIFMLAGAGAELIGSTWYFIFVAVAKYRKNEFSACKNHLFLLFVL